MKKLICKLTAYMVLVFMVISTLVSCFQNPPLVLDSNQIYLVMQPSNEQVEITDDTTLLSYMHALKDKGDLDFETKDGMITSINGIENTSNYSSCWMLYTSDEENANTSWGTVKYQFKVYGSAMYGAEQLKIKEGYLYIWVYQSF